eukprot:scaffold122398_cov25-Tisochrysis_lutea.AAC.1
MQGQLEKSACVPVGMGTVLHAKHHSTTAPQHHSTRERWHLMSSSSRQACMRMLHALRTQACANRHCACASQTGKHRFQRCAVQRFTTLMSMLAALDPYLSPL